MEKVIIYMIAFSLFAVILQLKFRAEYSLYNFKKRLLG